MEADLLQDKNSFFNLEELKLDWGPFDGRPHLFTFNRDKYPRLRRLDLSDIMVIGLELPPSIEFLRICGGRSDNWAPVEGARLPNLHTLILSHLSRMLIDYLLSFLEASQSPLRVLHFDHCQLITGQALKQLTRVIKVHELTELSVANVLRIDDVAMDALITEMREMKILDLSYTNITGCTIKTLADARASDEPNTLKISRIYARGCEELSSDAVAYGRARGIEVFT